MGRTPLSSVLGFVGAINFSDISADIPKIKCPMLVITTEGSSLASIEQTRAWQQQVPNSELLVLARRFLPHRGDRSRSLRQGNAGFHQAPQRRGLSGSTARSTARIADSLDVHARRLGDFCPFGELAG